MEVEILNIVPKSFYGFKMNMSLNENKTHKLFQQLMLCKKKHGLQSDFVYDIISYPTNYFQHFDPATSFTKWAAIENKEQQAPAYMLSLELTGGLYAKFINPYGFGNPQVYTHIYNKWLPSSTYKLDNRPHFDRFIPQNENKNIREEIFIPIIHI